MLFLEEDRLRVEWSAADIEVWLKSGRKNSQRREIVVDSYEITIFPAESVNNSQTVAALDSGLGASSTGSLTSRTRLNLIRLLGTKVHKTDYVIGVIHQNKRLKVS